MQKLYSFLFVLILSTVLISCGSSGSDTDSNNDSGTDADSQALVATAVLPIPGATGVDLISKVIVALNEAIDPASLATNSFQLLNGTTVVTATTTHDPDNNLIILVPDAVLANDTQYTAVLSAGVTDLAGNSLAADFNWSFTTLADSSALPDTQAPMATAVQPMTDQTGVDLSTKVIVAFNEAIDPASLGVDSFQLQNGAVVVAATTTHDPDNNLITLVPDEALANNTQYTPVLSAGVTDLAGNSLATDYSWSFTTLPDTSAPADTQAPMATAVQPMINQTGVDLSTKVIVAFNEAIDPASLAADSFQLQNGAVVVVATTTHDPDNNLVTLVPDATLANDTQYSAVVSAGVTDLAGNSLGTDFIWSFTTLTDSSAPADTLPPVATAVLPMTDQNGVDVFSKVIVAFNEAIDPASLAADSFQLLNGAVVVAASMTYDPDNNFITLVPDVVLTNDTQYTAMLSASVTDLAGNSLGTDFIWSFTTRSDNTVPQLLSIQPAEDDMNVALDVVLTAQFDEPMDPASLSGFGLSGVTGTVSLSGNGNTIQFVADQPLDNLTLYQANLPDTLSDLAGNQLNFSRSWSFTTLADLIAPQVIQTLPVEAAVIPINERQITIDFDEPLDGATVNAINITATESGVPITFTGISNFPTDRIVLSMPELTFDTGYAIQLSTGLTDLVGNALAAPFVLNFRVEPDNFPPSITGRAPGAEGRVIPPDAVLSVQFSEAMDQNLISSATVNIQGVAGLVAYDNITNSAMFIPNVDLTPGQQYTAQVSGSLTDLAGNTLAADEAWTFQVDGIPLQISDDSDAGHGPSRVAFAGTDGFAVWSVMSGNGVKLVAARRNTSSTSFATEQTIVEYPNDRNHLQPVIASNGSNFAMVWVRPSNQRIYASVFSAGSWSAPEQLGSAGGGFGRVGIISNGSGYAAGWNNSFTYFAAIHDGVSWSVSTLGATSTTGSGSVGPLELASDGIGYAMTWVGRVSVFVNANWSTINTGGSNIQIAAGTSGYAVSYLQFAVSFPGRNWIFARVHNGTSWSTSTQLTNFADIGQDQDIASNGASYAVIATARIDATTGNKFLELYQFNGTGWDLSTLKTVAWNETGFTDVQIASNGTTYAVTWRSNSALLSIIDQAPEETVFAADVDESELVAAGSNYFVVQLDSASRIRARVFVNSWLNATALGLTDSLAQSLEVVANGSGVLIGYGTDTADARLASYSTFTFSGNTATVSTNVLLVTDTHLGGVRNPVVAVNGSGDSMVVWEQFHLGDWQLRGRSVTNGIAGPVRIISAGGQSADMAADTSTFMIVWEDNREVFASRYTPVTNTLTTATLLGAANLSDSPSVAYNGTSFLAGWTDLRDVNIAEYTGTWGIPSTLYTDSSNFQRDVKVASSNGEYAITWIDPTFSGSGISALVRSAGSWGSRTFLDNGSIFQSSLFTNGNGYAAVYRDSFNIFGRVYDGVSWSAATNLGSSNYHAATDGNEYRVLVGSTIFDERVFNAGIWSDRIDSNLRASSLASDGSGYALLGVEIDGVNSVLFSATRNIDGWSSNVPVITIADGDFDSISLGNGTDSYVPVWSQPATLEPIAKRLWLLPEL